jgi:hypothetical protein
MDSAVHLIYISIYPFQAQSSLPPAQARAGFQQPMNSSSCSAHDMRHSLTRRNVEVLAVESKGISALDSRRESAVDTNASAPSKNDQADHSLASVTLLKRGVT